MAEVCPHILWFSCAIHTLDLKLKEIAGKRALKIQFKKAKARSLTKGDREREVLLKVI